MQLLVENCCNANGYPKPTIFYNQDASYFQWNNENGRIVIVVWNQDENDNIVVEFRNVRCGDYHNWLVFSYEELKILLYEKVLPLLFITQ